MTTLNTHQRDYINALRSGDYEQIEGVLKAIYTDDDDPGRERTGYCCLGVACELAGVELLPDISIASQDFQAFGLAYGDDENRVNDVQHNELPEWLNRALGLTINDNMKLASLNDEEASFAEIADMIEYAILNDVTIHEADLR